MDKCNIGDVIELAAQDLIIEDQTYLSNENSEEIPTFAESMAVLVENVEDQNEIKSLICKQFGFEEMVYKRVIGMTIYISQL